LKILTRKVPRVCQALLTKEFPNVQCFPVAQPDGGRDALAYFLGDPERTFIMYQVKFNRRALAEPDPHKWLLAKLKEEAPKLKKQIPKVQSNLSCLQTSEETAHPQSGSIDKVNELLNSELGVPSTCWWRDDLSRRLDNAWDLKWVYFELMTGPDLIRSVIESQLSENRERRADAIRAFVKHQFCNEQEVKFKQVELQNRLLDLFIDVPVSPPQRVTTAKREHHYHKIQQDIANDIERRNSGNAQPDLFDDITLPTDVSRRYYMSKEERGAVGAATLLLHHWCINCSSNSS
jgi:hypothetical protein